MKNITSKPQATSQTTPPTIRAFQAFVRGIGISNVTAWRFEKRGWIHTVNIAGRRYITAEAEADFVRRAEAGEFAKKHKAPCRTTSDKGAL